MTQALKASEHWLQAEAEAARDLLAHIADLVDDDDQMAADAVEGETSLHEALKRAIAEIDDCKVISDGCASVIETMQARKRRADHRREKVRAAIEQALVTCGQEKVALPTATLTIARRPGKAIITDEALIPAEFWEPQRPKLDKASLNKAVLDRDVPGATRSNGSISLTIRRG